MLVIKEDTREAMINEQPHRAGAGSVLFFASGDLHGVKNIGETRATYLVFRFLTATTPPATAN